MENTIQEIDANISKNKKEKERMQYALDVRNHELEFIHLRYVCQNLAFQIQKKTREFNQVQEYPEKAQPIFNEIQSLTAEYEKAGEELKNFVASIRK